MLNIILDNNFPPEIPFEIAPEDRQFCLIHSESVAVRRIKNEHSLTRNYYPVPIVDAKPQLIMKIGRTEEVYGSNLTDRESKVKYMSPTETIKNLLDSYCYSDFEPFELPVTILLSSSKLSDPALL